MTTEHKIKRLLNLYDGDLCYILDEFEKIRAVALAAEDLLSKAKATAMRADIPMKLTILEPLQDALKAWREE